MQIGEQKTMIVTGGLKVKITVIHTLLSFLVLVIIILFFFMTMTMPPPVVSWFFLLFLRKIDIEDTFEKKEIFNMKHMILL